LLLITALRLGNVPEQSIDQLLEHTRARKNKTIVWSHPERPVLCAIGQIGATILVDKPAGNHQLTQTMEEAGLSAGLLSKTRAHDLRRGAAQDTANLEKSKLVGFVTPGVSAALGHGQNSRGASHTAHYIGSLTDDVWSKRVEENFINPYGIDETDNMYPKKFQHLKPEQITELCQTEGLDPSNKHHRKQASNLYEKRRRQEWMNEERTKRMAISYDEAGMCHTLPSLRYMLMHS
jgi:hypothetical protein